MTELEDYFCALTLQLSMMTEDREAGQLGKAAVASDSQVAVEQMLQEARALEQSYMLAKSLAECDIVPDTLVDEMNHLDTIASSDRELAERLERCEYGAEVELRAKSERFERAIRYFYTAAECCTCIERKQTYTSPCGHAYCQDCAQSLYDFALTDRKLIPVRCCRMPFDSDIAPVCLMTEEDLNKYLTIKGEIEHPCPPVAELDRAASILISEKGWKFEH
ncbi:hypothetical protein BGZ99_005285 [Dissophora globulifera]|uniref:RING-type domain-containing protein n=1 Tax=Dissophora globulifera TaxID=979702 RepID=A0A9P6RHZ1_9FUNG|nr:hypothetical protein BGZ99_005285 [Dissophora globulifera]